MVGPNKTATCVADSKPLEVADVLAARIARGEYGTRGRLPAERELSAELGASRATVRDALSRLAGWGMVDIRRGSGATARPARAWTLGAMPAVLRSGAGPDPSAWLGLAEDALALRRAVADRVVRRLAGRVEPGALAPARRAVARAWERRHDFAAFAEQDLEMVRCLLEAGGQLPSVWLVNALGRVYLEVVPAFAAQIPIPVDYVEVHEAFFDALEAGEGERARGVLGAYLARVDEAITALAEASR